MASFVHGENITISRTRDSQRYIMSSFGGMTVSAWSAAAHDHLTGGDWCEMFAVSDSLLAITIGDVCGHGARASVEMNAIVDEIEVALRELENPADTLARINIAAYGRNQAVPVTGIVALLDASLGTLTFANAGHPPPLMIGPHGNQFLQFVADIPLGITAQYNATLRVIPLVPDTLLVFYTDGVTEHNRDPIMGEKQLLLAARRSYACAGGNAARDIANDVFDRSARHDDAAILTLRTRAAYNSSR